MSVDWNEPSDAVARSMFECAAADAAVGYVETLAQLQEAQERIKKLEAQLAALIGIGN